MNPALILLITAIAAPPGDAADSTGGAVRTSTQEERPVVRAVRASEPISVDGVLAEVDWTHAPASGALVQLDPVEGAPGTQVTEVRFLYDSEALYVGARLSDSGAVTRRLGRRDMDPVGSDWLRVSLDSYRDRRTAYRFEVNPSGVRRDAHLSGDGSDDSWDPVWEVATRVDADGWTVEMRIPFAVLRYQRGADRLWGVQVERVIDRLQETALLAFTPKSEVGGIAAFADLAGIGEITGRGGIELLPYAVGSAVHADPGLNPYRDGSDRRISAGLDARVSLSSALSLAAAVNPDFGQVEADPAVINLTAFETFFDEKRPFFIEGSSRFDFGTGALFYSRRIGRAPQLRAPSAAADVPPAASIAAAAKLAGRTASGWSIGVLDAVTTAEYARYRDPDGADRRALVEPAANALVARVEREGREGRSSIGGIITALNRSLASDAAVASLREAAYAGGIDFLHQANSRAWSIGGHASASHILGSAAAITAAQRSSVRYFARPDADHLEVDQAATSLTGYSAQLRVQRHAGQHVRANVAAALTSPGFEVNDLGFQSRADRGSVNAGVRYLENRPGQSFRNWAAGLSVSSGWNLGGDWIEKSLNGEIQTQHVSYWRFIVAGGIQLERLNDRLTRGGPLALSPTVWNYGILLSSDARRALSGSLRARREEDAAGMDEDQLALFLALRPSPRWSLSAGPAYVRLHEPTQYAGRVEDATAASTFGARYFFAPLDYSELSLEARLDVNFTPDLTVELYVQPFLSSGEFAAPRELTTPGANRFRRYPDARRVDSGGGAEYVFDPDAAGPAPEIHIPDRDFTAHSLRGNAVLRWEWRPGSTLFLVWQHGRAVDNAGSSTLGAAAARALLDTRSDNLFAIKLSYWLSPRL